MNGLTPEQQATLRGEHSKSHKLKGVWLAATLAAVDDLINPGRAASELPNANVPKGEIAKPIDYHQVASMQQKGRIPAEATLIAASRAQPVKSTVRTTATIKRTTVTVNRSSLS